MPSPTPNRPKAAASQPERRASIDELPIPDGYKQDLRRATQILSRLGCSGIYLFGSLASGDLHGRSDIDLAVRQCPKGQFFRVYGRLMMELDHSVDLVSLKHQKPFARYLEENRELVRIA